MAILDVRRVPRPDLEPVLYSYEFRSSDSDTIGPVEQEFSATIDQSLVAEFCGEVGAVVARSQRLGLDGPIDHVKGLATLGKVLHRALFPELDGYIPDLLDRIRACDGREPLLIRTNETLVPWELLHDGTQFFGLKYDLGRHWIGPQKVRPGRVIRSIGRALIVADPCGDLEDALEEAKSLKAFLDGHGTRCVLRSGAGATLAQVIKDLSQGTYDLFHYSGHATLVPNSKEAALVLHGGKLLRESSIRAVLSGGSPPVVFVNGCESAEPLSNLCSAFMATGSQVAIGTLFKVAEGTARALAEHFYAGLADDLTAGAAMREARSKVTSRTDAGWAAFVLYGNPGMRIQPGDGSATSPAGPTDPSVGPPVENGSDGVAQPRWSELLDSDAAALMRRASAFGAPRSLVTSLDLLVELMEVDGTLRRALDRRGVNRAAVIDQLRNLMDTVSPGAPSGPLLSDSVKLILADAVRAAGRAGRSTATVDDLTDGFVNAGGGTSGQLLAQAGLPLADVVGAAGTGRLEPGNPPSVFDDAGELLDRHFGHSAHSGLQAAALVAKAQESFISSASLLVGFAFADSRVLRDALEEQGPAVREVRERLFSAPNPLVGHAYRLRRGNFSQRTVDALDQALVTEQSAGSPWIGDAAVLVALLDDHGSSVRHMLEGWGVDVTSLRLSLTDRLGPGRLGPRHSGPGRSGPRHSGPGHLDDA